MKRLLKLGLIIILSNVLAQVTIAQSASASGNTMAESKFAATPVNSFTGIPSIGVPIFNYSHPGGIGFNISLDYFAGGIRLNEKSSTVGVGWNLNAGGAVIRTVRGMPDDFPVKGFLYAGPVPANFPAMGTLYYGDSIDAEQDVFQLSAEGVSCQFFIGKNKQIVTVPLSKTKVSYQTSPVDSSRIISFTVVSTTGIKYIFNELEQTTNGDGFGGVFQNIPYTTAWYLSHIIAPFATDSIKLNYQTVVEPSVKVPFSHEVKVKIDGTYDPVSKPVGIQSISLKKLSSVVFPDNKRVEFIYDQAIKYDGVDFVLNRIKVFDSVFRYGYLLDRDSINPTLPRGHLFLTGVRYYTSTFVNPGYKFNYNLKYNPSPRSETSAFNNRRDHWGFYNGIDNALHAIPTTTGIFGTFTGANRNPVDSLAGANTLSSVTDANGGITYYKFESNDIYIPYNASPQFFTINAKAITQNNISIAHTTNNKDSFIITFASTARYRGVDPVSGNIIFSITNADSTITYTTNTINLDSLYYKGSVGFVCTNLPNGNVVFKSRLASGAVISLPQCNLNVSWVKYSASGQTKTISGGIRIKQISHFDPVTGRTDTLKTYNYTMPDGKSSGFSGGVPFYTHPYQSVSVSINGASTTSVNYTSIVSDPVNNLIYSQGSPVGYKRVEIISGSTFKNLGKSVIEYSTLLDAEIVPDAFPYPPVQQKTWLVGLPKRVLVYDSLNDLRQSTTNGYTTQISNYVNDNYKSCKLGKTATLEDLYFGDREETYLGAFYHVVSGRSDLTSTIDSFFHSNDSATVTRKDIVYDTNYNPIKIISPFDKSRNLSVENRIYYPYNYTLTGVVGKLKDSSIFVPISSENWITGDGNPRMLSAQITEYQQLSKGYIRPLSIYASQANSPVPESTVGLFNPGVLVRNSNIFIKQQSFTQYDNLSNAIEVKSELSQLSNAVIMDHDGTVPVAKVSNAKNLDIAYTSFEADGKGNWTISSPLRLTTSAVTGTKSYLLSNGAISKTDLTASTIYIITYWTTAAGPVSIPNSTGSTIIASQNGWNLYSQTLTGQTSVTISGTATIDELRLYPKDANMETSNFDPIKGIISSCDAGNTTTYYEYDQYNRLKTVRDRNKNVRKKYEYPNNVTSISTAPNWQPTGTKVCVMPLNGSANTVERDLSVYSETYNVTREVFFTANCNGCTRTCNINSFQKMINCNCETATRENLSSTYVNIYNPGSGQNEWMWECTFIMYWSDGTSMGPLSDYSTTSCPIY